MEGAAVAQVATQEQIPFVVIRVISDNANEESELDFNYFLEDYKDAPNPHLYWADGPFQVTCFDSLKTYLPHSLTYPVQCRFFEDVPSS